MQKLLAIFVLLTACDDDGKPLTPPDATPGIDTTLPAIPEAVIVSGTFTPGEPGVMSALNLQTLEVEQRVSPTGAVAEDPMIRAIDGQLYVVNRAGGNNVTVLSPYTFALVDQLATGAGSNPQDVAKVGDKLFVPAMGTAGVLVLEGTETRTIDLSAIDTADGLPDCLSAFAVGNDVYVACGLLDTFVAAAPGKVVVIDATTETVRTMFDLQFRNPFGVFERLPDGHLVIPTVPDFSDFSTGCLEKIMPGTTPALAGCAVTNQALDGYAASARVLEDPSSLMIVSSKFDTGPVGRLWSLDLATGALAAAPMSPEGQLIVDVATCNNGDVVVADSTMASNGVRVYRGGEERTTAPLAIGLRPNASHGLVCY